MNARRTEYAVRVEDLTVAYGAKPVLWDVDLMIPAGRLTAIVGPNGAGKTTLIKAIWDFCPRCPARCAFCRKRTPAPARDGSPTCPRAAAWTGIFRPPRWTWC